MKRRTLLLLVFIALLATSLLIFFFHFFRFSKTWHVPKDYPTIQLAINGAAEGDTIKVASGIYFEHIVVNKALHLVGEHKETTIIDGNGTGTVVFITANNVHITQFTIQNSGQNYSDCGINLSHVSQNIIKNNRIVNCRYDGIIMIDTTYSDISYNVISNNTHQGIVLLRSHNNILHSNNITFNGWSEGASIKWCGIELIMSENNVITNNIIQNNYYGIRFFNEEAPLGKNNTLRFNNISKNKYNFGFRKATKNYLEGFIQNIDTSNTVDGKPIYYWVNEADKAIPPDAGYVALINCKRITIQNLNLCRNGEGILLVETTSSTILENNIADNDYGIRLSESSNNHIYHNNFKNNTEQIYSYNSVNTWDNGYPSGGNYWSDYKGIDEKNGPNQDQFGSDGIGDSPYSLDVKNQDNYPLMKPYP